MKGLTDIPGIRVGHASDYDAITGCTVVLCEQGAVAGYEIRGSATGTEEFEVMSALHMAPCIHAVVLAGGSAFGLEAASGVRRRLEREGVGFDTGVAKVPLVPCAILFDLAIGRPNARPTREMGELAAAAATDAAVQEGSVGAGTGATVGKLFGMERAMKGGVGSYTLVAGGPKSKTLVSALAVVNALGDVVDPATGKILAGARKSKTSTAFADSARAMREGRASGFRAENTTLVVVATNARLTKAGATKLAQLASIGMARAIAPVWTLSDGDLVIALSLGREEAAIDTLGTVAAEAVAQSIVRAVKSARSLGGVPGLAG